MTFVKKKIKVFNFTTFYIKVYWLLGKNSDIQKKNIVIANKLITVIKILLISSIILTIIHFFLL